MKIRIAGPGVSMGAVLCLAGGLSCTDRPLPPRDPGAGVPPQPTSSAAASARVLQAGGVIVSTNAAGQPRFIRAVSRTAATTTTSPEAAARGHFARFAPAYGLGGDGLAGIRVVSAGRSPRGDHLVRLRQHIGDVEVYGSEIKVVMRPDLSLVALTGSPSDVAGMKPAARRFLLSPGQALSRALQDLYGLAVPDGVVAPAVASQPFSWLSLPGGTSVRLSDLARAKPVYFRSGAGLVAAYFLEFFSNNGPSTTSDAYHYLVAADDGRVLERQDLTADAAFNYRVFAESTGDRRPLDGPIADFTPHPTGIPDGSDPAFVAPALISMESFKVRPPLAVDPWLPMTAVQTLGNNVDAYADLFAPDGFSNGDLRATTTSPGTFDRIYDVTQQPRMSPTQTMAATTNLFYVVNWLHDYWYDSGFDEVAGNAQASNFGRGGLEADALRAEAQDGAGLNNANMSTPSDGLPPRMQMFLWSPPEISSLTIQPGALELQHRSAAFGPSVFDVTAELALADDATAPTADACQPLTNDVVGRIVLIDRGLCNFAAKALAAQVAGAVGVIIANNVAGPPPNLANSTPPLVIAIPAQSISLDDGNALKALLTAGPVTARLFRNVTGPGRDGSLDNMVIAHEWGHYFHHRLSQCGTFQCNALSEGWGDFIALHTALREGDNLDGTFGAGIYAPRVFGDTGYFGIRRFPYSVDFTRNALTFKHIQNGVPLPPVPTNPIGVPNSEAHNAGEVWASMLFEAYVGFQKNRGDRTFAEARRAFADTVVLGLQIAPIDATFTETRDAILTAASMTQPGDLQVIAGGFARRGAGSCAVSPPRESTTDLAPVVESFDVQPNVAVTSIDIDDSVESCDNDGTLDVGETGLVRVTVTNNGAAPLVGTQVTLASSSPGLVFPDGATASLADIAPFTSLTATVNVALDGTVTDLAIVDLTVTVTNATACVTSVVELRNPRVNADEVPGSTATEDVESAAPPWTRTGTGAETVWSRVALSPTNHAWQGVDAGTTSDTQLATPSLRVSPTADFQISFDHAFSFEFSDDIFFDGGVIEISSDDGATWRDISTVVDPGYNAIITDLSDNPLPGRPAFGSVNASFPALDHVSLNLGQALAGQTVRVRFRIATDGGIGAPGWTIDNIALAGIDNTPFTSVVSHRGQCQVPPVANAGPDRTVPSGADVILNGAGSSDPNGDPITFSWTQTGGPPVTILNPTSAVAAFRAPTLRRNRTLTFQLTVSDPSGSSTDTVAIEVREARRRGNLTAQTTTPLATAPLATE